MILAAACVGRWMRYAPGSVEWHEEQRRRKNEAVPA